MTSKNIHAQEIERMMQNDVAVTCPRCLTEFEKSGRYTADDLVRHLVQDHLIQRQMSEKITVDALRV